MISGMSFLDTSNNSIIVDSNQNVLSDSQGFVKKVGSVADILPPSLADTGAYQSEINGEEYQFHYQKIDEIDAYLI